MQSLKEDILVCLQGLKGSGKFASIFSEEFIFPGLKVEGLGEISFPLNEVQAKSLIKLAKKAPFGKGTQTITDNKVRSTWEMDADQLVLDNPNWHTFLNKIIKKVKNDLGLEDYTIEANLYKLLVYQEGDFFLKHKDSEKEKGMFGSLIIGLPSNYTGGELSISFEGEEVIADFVQAGHDYRIHCAAFYADCDHEVKPLTSGYRICFAYNLIQKECGKKIQMQSVNSYADNLARILKQNPVSQPYIILLGHQYTPENFSLSALKLNDRGKADVLLLAAQKLGYYAKMCLVTSYKSGAPDYNGHYEYGYDGGDDDANMEEVYDEWLNVEYWLDNELPPLSKVVFEESDLISSFKLAEDEPIVKESSGYMGNYGPELSHWYHYGAVIIWSPEQNAKLLGAQNAETQLEWIAYFNKTRKISPEEYKAVNSILSGDLRLGINSIDAKANFNAIGEWLIMHNMQDFWQQWNSDRLQLLFEKMDVENWQKIFEWLHVEIGNKILEKITKEINQPIVEKVIEMIRSTARNANTHYIAMTQASMLTDYFRLLNDKSKFELRADIYPHLFWIENNLLRQQEWINSISQSLTLPITRKYLHRVLVPQLLAEPIKSEIYNNLAQFCKEYLQKQADNKPQPPPDWSRPIPERAKNDKVWQMLKDFMESPFQEFFDFRKNQSERSEVESAILNQKVDLITSTIKKGSPHTLRITKTQDQYRRLLKHWQEDVALLETLKASTIF